MATDPEKAYPPPDQTQNQPYPQGQQAYAPPVGQPQAYPPGQPQYPPGQPQYPPAQGYPPQYQANPPQYYGDQPIQSTTTTAVVVTQPAAVTVTHNQEVDYSGKAMVALVLAIIGLIFCGTSLILLVCLVPALILAIIALSSPRGESASKNASISLGLTILSGVCFVVILIIVIVVPIVVVGATTAAAANSYRFSS